MIGDRQDPYGAVVGTRGAYGGRETVVMVARRPNTMSTAGLNRLGLKRKDEAWLHEALSSPTTRFVPLCNGKVCVAGPPASTVLLETGTWEDVWLLGEAEGTTYVAVEIDEDTWAELPVPEGARLASLREVATLLPPLESNMLALAAGLSAWHRTNQFCGTCGAPTRPEAAGHVRRCTGCAKEHFPRTDPAIIVLVTDGDRCLLARGPQWPVRFASALAGFVEPGESLEDAVAREVFEEVGIVVDEVEYQSSQPWPFPASVMLAFRATAATTEITMDPTEIADAQWYSREDVADGIVNLPGSVSIARRLIDDWIAEGS